MIPLKLVTNLLLLIYIFIFTMWSLSRNDFVKIQGGGVPPPNFTQGGLPPPPSETAYDFK